MQDWLRRGQPNCFVPYDRMPVDPFRDPFRVTFRAEGTVRGTGGIRIASSDCATDVAGLYVAGDAASREQIAGATSGGGGPNSSWAIASGWWSGQGAALHAKRRSGKAFKRHSSPLGKAGLRPVSTTKNWLTPKDVIDSVRAEVTPLERTISAKATVCGSVAKNSTQSGTTSKPSFRSRPQSPEGARSSSNCSIRTLVSGGSTRPQRKSRHTPPKRLRRQRNDVCATHHVTWDRRHLRLDRALQSAGDGVLIEIVSQSRCVECDICVKVCPADVFDASDSAPSLPVRMIVRPAFYARFIAQRTRFTSPNAPMALFR